MKRDVRPASVTNAPDTGGSALTVLLSLADTTWRVAVPTVLFSGAGIVLDKRLDTMPWLTLLGLVVGLTFAGKLVWEQLQKVNKQEDNK